MYKKYFKKILHGQSTPNDHFNGSSTTRYMKNDIFRPWEDNEALLGLEVPCFNTIDALMYLANNTIPNSRTETLQMVSPSKMWFGVEPSES